MNYQDKSQIESAEIEAKYDLAKKFVLFVEKICISNE